MQVPLAPDPSAVDHVARQLVDVGDRLCREFAVADGPTAESVREQVREARAGFGSPTVIIYLPVLVERAVRHDLRRAASTRATTRRAPRG